MDDQPLSGGATLGPYAPPQSAASEVGVEGLVEDLELDDPQLAPRSSDDGGADSRVATKTDLALALALDDPPSPLDPVRQPLHTLDPEDVGASLAPWTPIQTPALTSAVQPLTTLGSVDEAAIVAAEEARVAENNRLERIELLELLHPPLNRPMTRRDTFVFVSAPNMDWMRESIQVRKRKRRKGAAASGGAGGAAATPAPGTAPSTTPRTAKSAPGAARAALATARSDGEGRTPAPGDEMTAAGIAAAALGPVEVSVWRCSIPRRPTPGRPPTIELIKTLHEAAHEIEIRIEAFLQLRREHRAELAALDAAFLIRIPMEELMDMAPSLVQMKTVQYKEEDKRMKFLHMDILRIEREMEEEKAVLRKNGIGRSLILIASVRGSNSFAGYARVIGPISTDTGLGGMARASKPFKIVWLDRYPQRGFTGPKEWGLPFADAACLRNAAHNFAPISACSDGDQIDSVSATGLVAMIKSGAVARSATPQIECMGYVRNKYNILVQNPRVGRMMKFDIEAERARRAFEHCDNAGVEAARFASMVGQRQRKGRPGARETAADSSTLSAQSTFPLGEVLVGDEIDAVLRFPAGVGEGKGEGGGDVAEKAAEEEGGAEAPGSVSGASVVSRASRRSRAAEAEVAVDSVAGPREPRFYVLGLERVYHVQRSHAECEALFDAIVARKGRVWVEREIARAMPLNPTDRRTHNDVVSRRARGGGGGGSGVIASHEADEHPDGAADVAVRLLEERYTMRARVCREKMTRILQAIVCFPELRQAAVVRAFFARDAPFVLRRKSKAQPYRYF